MATNYNPRSGSSASRNRKRAQQRKDSPEARQRQLERPLPSPNRSKISYIQSAKTDLSAQTQAKDPRARYARFRSAQSVRVLGDSKDPYLRERHQVNERPGDRSPRSGRSAQDSGRARRTGRDARRDARGMTVREHRVQQRRTARRTSGVFRRVLVAVIILLVLGVAAFLVYQSPAFSVREINVEGAQRLGSARLTELAAVPESSTLLRLDAKGIQSRIESDPWVESVSVQRSFPSTVILTVKERQIAAVVEVPSARSNEPALNWLVSHDGHWLGSFASSTVTTGEGDGDQDGGEGSEEGAEGGAEGESTTGEDENGDGDDAGSAAGEDGTDAEGEQNGSAANAGGAGNGVSGGTQGGLLAGSEPSILKDVQVTASEVESLPLIKEISHSAIPQIGASVTDEGILNALSALNGFSPEMLALVQSVSAPDRVKTMIMLRNNVGIAFGAAEDVEVKEKVILGLLAEHEGTITYINVRVADRATYRAVT